MKRHGAILSAAWVLAAAWLCAQTAGGGFRHERPIVTSGAGHYRLAIDVPLLTGSQPVVVPLSSRSSLDGVRLSVRSGLGDLRLFDAAGREVPYLLVAPPDGAEEWTNAGILPIADTKKSSGFEADLGSVMRVDRLRLWGLTPPFLKRLVLEGSGDRQHWTMLVAEGTLFDLPDSQLRQIDLPFEPGEYRYLRVTWDDTNSGRVGALGRAEARKVVLNAPRPPATAPLVVEKRPSEPGSSRYAVRLPGPHLPIVALLLDVDAEHVLREADVSEARLIGLQAGPVSLGNAMLRRVMVGPIAASDLRIPIETPLEAELALKIDDGDNQPLTIRGIKAEFAELPWIYFESDGTPIVARYGGDRREAPRYDLEAARDSLRIDTAREASWGESRSLPVTVETSSAPMPLEGAPIDLALFRYVRDIPAGDAGLVALPLDAGVLAHSNASSFADLRVVTADGHQVPYLIERRGELLSLDLKIEKFTGTLPENTRGGQRSAYRIQLPYASLPEASLVLTTTARVFDRSITLGIEQPADRRHRDRWMQTIAVSRWVHADRDRPAPPLPLSIQSSDSTDLVLVIDEGDNQPLPLGQTQLLLPGYRVRFYRPGGAALRLAYGRDDLASPRYDLALLSPYVLGVPAVAAAPPAPEAARADTGSAALVSPTLFWSVLGVAVVVLLGFVVKLVRGVKSA